MKGGGLQLLLMMVSWIKGIFHRAVLVAAGDTLCPFSKTIEEKAGCKAAGESGDDTVEWGAESSAVLGSTGSGQRGWSVALS